jgi:APA family basic amino acid/polyamine antiporter
MARDGLLPQGFFGDVHPRFRTPWKSAIVTGVFAGLLSSLLPLRILSDLVNTGTLLAFVIACSAALIMRRTHPTLQDHFGDTEARGGTGPNRDIKAKVSDKL